MALRFAGTAGNFLQLASPPPMGGMTILGWGTLSVDRNALSTLFSFENDSPYAYIGMDFPADGTTLGIDDSGINTTVLALSVGDRFFWCLTCAGAGTNTLTGYAARVGDTALVSAQRNVAVASNAGGLFFRLGDNRYSEPYNGTIDNVIVYDSVLTAAEVNAQWRRRAPIKQPWSWLTANETTAVYTDKSGNGRNWSLTGTALAVEDGIGVSWGAPIIYSPYGAAATGPVLSLPGVNSITSTTAIPKVTLTF